MKHLSNFLRPVALLLLSFTLFTACQQSDKAVRPEPAADKLVYLSERLENPDLTDAERKKVNDLYNSLTYEETEKLIDVRSDYYLKMNLVSAERADYLRELRHKMNQAAFRQKGKSFYQLEFADSEEIIQAVKPRKETAADTDPNARTAGDCVLTSNPPCTAWSGNGSILISYEAGDKQVSGTYIGDFTVQCGANSFQDDCDYVFRYQYSKLYTYKYWKDYGARVGFFGASAGTKLIDNNPNRTDCGTYTLQILMGKTRIDVNYGTAAMAATNMRLTLSRSIQSGWCYTGTSGSEKWYYGGVYSPSWDGWGGGSPLTGYPVCACTIDNYVVY